MRATNALTTFAIACGLGACGAGHASVGPHLRHDGGAGATLAASLAFGGAVDDRRIVAVGGTLMATIDDFARLGGALDVNYIDTELVVPMRATVRVGGLTRIKTTDPDGNLPAVDYPSRLAVGAAIAFYPLHARRRTEGDPDPAPARAATTWRTKPDDDMLSGLDDVFKRSPSTSDDDGVLLAGLGFELAIDALPTTAPGDPRELYVSLSLVGEFAGASRPKPRR